MTTTRWLQRLGSHILTSFIHLPFHALPSIPCVYFVMNCYKYTYRCIEIGWGQFVMPPRMPGRPKFYRKGSRDSSRSRVILLPFHILFYTSQIIIYIFWSPWRSINSAFKEVSSFNFKPRYKMSIWFVLVSYVFIDLLKLALLELNYLSCRLMSLCHK